jgi:hypothetical protein
MSSVLSGEKKPMSEESIQIRFDSNKVTDCSSAIIVPEKAIDEAGYIRTLTCNANAHSKHEFHALAQMAYYQFQDSETQITEVHGSIALELAGEVEELQAGMVIYRDISGNLHILAHTGQNMKKLLETANRFCTRWVRLDI